MNYTDETTIDEAKKICRKIYFQKRDSSLGVRVWYKIGSWYWKAGVYVTANLREIKNHGCGRTKTPKNKSSWKGFCDKEILIGKFPNRNQKSQKKKTLITSE